MRAASFELERRRPVWEALSELYLDVELQSEDHQRIARVLSASGYSEFELEQILRREVGPLLFVNLLSVAGEWTGFDLGWLEASILRSERRRDWLQWLPAAVSFRMVRHDWDCIRALLIPESTG
jgi:hypothetical protein